MNRVMMVCTLVAVGVVSCSRPQAEPEIATAGKPVIYTVNYPLKYFAERIGGDLVEVRFPAPTDEDPAYWSPDAKVVAAYQQADMILLNGAGYAQWVDKVSLPSAGLVDAGTTFADRWIELVDHTTHTHGPTGKHAHGGYAFTTWLDPTLAVEQARTIKDALARRWPEHTSRLEQNFAELEKDLMAIDEQIQAVVSQNRDRPVVFSHPVYQYLEQRYGLNGHSVHWEPDGEPDEQMWQELKELLASHPACWMIWEAHPLPNTVARLQELGVASSVFDPCGKMPEKGDYLDTMQANARRLATLFDTP